VAGKRQKRSRARRKEARLHLENRITKYQNEDEIEGDLTRSAKRIEGRFQARLPRKRQTKSDEAAMEVTANPNSKNNWTKRVKTISTEKTRTILSKLTMAKDLI
jgi:hypothetical protein